MRVSILGCRVTRITIVMEMLVLVLSLPPYNPQSITACLIHPSSHPPPHQHCSTFQHHITHPLCPPHSKCHPEEQVQPPAHRGTINGPAPDLRGYTEHGGHSGCLDQWVGLWCLSGYMKHQSSILRFVFLMWISDALYQCFGLCYLFLLPLCPLLIPFIFNLCNGSHNIVLLQFLFSCFFFCISRFVLVFIGMELCCGGEEGSVHHCNHYIFYVISCPFS